MSDDYFVVEWEVEDGYVGKSRPHSFKFYSSWLHEEMTEDEIQDELLNETEQHFNNMVSFYIKNKDEFIEWAKETLENMREYNEKDN